MSSPQNAPNMSFSHVPLKVPTQPSSLDVSLITELYDAIEENPAGIEPRKILIQLLMTCDWLDAARDALNGLLAIVPHDKDAKDWSNVLHTKAEPEVSSKKSSPEAHNQVADICTVQNPHSETSGGHKTVFSNFLDKFLKQTPKNERDSEQVTSTCLEPSGGGRPGQATQIQSKPVDAHLVARQMVKNPVTAVDIAFLDLKEITIMMRSTLSQSQTSNNLDTDPQTVTSENDTIREVLQKRTEALISALPVNLQQAASIAQMHIEHEILHRTYLCTETMYGDPVSEIPRERFLVTEDGYPWDMEELAQAIASNGGVMRNPLSRQLFTPNDVKAIIQHPLGKCLAALQLAQNELTKGVRPSTIDELVKLSAVMLKDDSADQLESRHALDEYLAYIATLPGAEQIALDKLRVPAKDNHTGQKYDSSIGDAVRDARGNRVCIHKIGDFLGQAAKYLRQKN